MPPDVSTYLSPRTVLVTGGSGFIGTNLVEHLAAAGHTVVNADIALPRHPGHAERWRAVDVGDREGIHQVIDDVQPDVVVHLAARTDLGSDDVAGYNANTAGVEHVVDAVKATPSVQRVLFSSTQLVCEPGYVPRHDTDYRPINAYGRSKMIGEEYVRRHAGDDVAWVLLRPTSIWGPWWGDLYSTFFRTVRTGRYLHPRNVRVAKAFGYVGNTVHQMAALVGAPPAAIHGRTLYLSDYEPYPILEWAQEIAAVFGARRVREVPIGVLKALALGGDAAARLGVAHPPITSYRLKNMVTPTAFDMAPLEAICGALPFTRTDGTAATVEWMRAEEQRS